MIVIGSGPNGLVAAACWRGAASRCWCSRRTRAAPGGALGSEALTLPGFVHDVGGGFFPFGASSPAFRELDLSARRGMAARALRELPPRARRQLRLHRARRRDRRSRTSAARATRTRFASWRARHAGLERDSAGRAAGPVSERRPARCVSAARPARDRAHVHPQLPRPAVAPVPERGRAARAAQPGPARRRRTGRSVRGGARLHARDDRDDRRLRRSERRRAEHDRRAACRLARHGGEIRLGARVTRVIVRGGARRPSCSRTGRRSRPGAPSLADTSPAALLLDHGRRARGAGLGARVHGAVPARVGDLQGGLGAVGAGALAGRGGARERGRARGREPRRSRAFHARGPRRPAAERPYLVIGQQSLPIHARPAGKHTLYCYTHVPSQVDGGWARRARGVRGSRRGPHRGAGARIPRDDPGQAHHGPAGPGGLEREPGRGRSRRRLERLAPPAAVPADVSVFPLPHAGRGLYLCSSYAHPGGGVHGMCGYNAARSRRATPSGTRPSM